MTKDLTKGKPFQTIFTFSIPIVCGNLFQLFYTLADTIIVGQTLGSDALAAVGSTSIIVYLVLCFIQGITGGFGICLAQQFGKRDESGMRKSISVSLMLSIAASVAITLLCCLLSHKILYWMNTPSKIYGMAYDYMFVVLLGTGATIFYNLISNILRALGDSQTPLIFLIFSSIVNIILDIIFIVPLNMSVAGAAWATVFSQLLSALLCTCFGIKKFPILRITHNDFLISKSVWSAHLRTGFPMGFQMSVMCIGQLAMQGAVNALGANAIAGYTAATKVDQASVLVNAALGIAISNFVAQNYGAQLKGRIKEGVTSCLILASSINFVMCLMILVCRHLVIPLFVNNPTAELSAYSDQYFFAVAPFYLLLGVLVLYRSAVQSMGNSIAPFFACLIELAARIGATVILSKQIGYIGICFATPLAWIGASLFLIPTYRTMMRRNIF